MTADQDIASTILNYVAVSSTLSRRIVNMVVITIDCEGVENVEAVPEATN